LAGCQSLPAPIKSVNLAASGTQVLVALIGLLLIAAGGVVYRRSRRSTSGPSEKSLPNRRPTRFGEPHDGRDGEQRL
jgi:LPXTG-motif cell wall-anchored protein